MPQHRLSMTTAKAEKLFAIDIIDAPPPLQVEAVDRPPLAAIAPDPPIEPMPPTPPPPAPVPQEEPAPSPPPPPPPTTAAEIEAAADRRRRLGVDAKAAKKRLENVQKPAALKLPAPPPIATPPHDTRH
jgi:hypothetical protein